MPYWHKAGVGYQQQDYHVNDNEYDTAGLFFDFHFIPSFLRTWRCLRAFSAPRLLSSSAKIIGAGKFMSRSSTPIRAVFFDKMPDVGTGKEHLEIPQTYPFAPKTPFTGENFSKEISMPNMGR